MQLYVTRSTSSAATCNWYSLLTSQSPECRDLAWHLPVPLWGLATPWCATRPWCCPEVGAGCVPTTEHVGDGCCSCSPQLRGYWAYWNLYSDRHSAESHCLSRWGYRCVYVPSHTAKLQTILYHFLSISLDEQQSIMGHILLLCKRLW